MSQILLRPSDEFKKEITDEAKRVGISVNALLLQVLRDWMDNLKAERRQLNE